MSALKSIVVRLLNVALDRVEKLRDGGVFLLVIHIAGREDDVTLAELIMLRFVLILFLAEEVLEGILNHYTVIAWI
jgi:hypothetical protein